MQRKTPRRAVDGVLLLDKPQGLTSNAALQTARRLFNAAKAGHTGTLDPMATGLLPLTFGEATKFSQMLLDADKGYEATVKLGVETDTGDAEGVVVATHPVAATVEAVADVLPRFTGEIEQVPPMHSALKRNGKPLYEYARAGVEVERAARRVHIHRLELLGMEGDCVRIAVDCSKGTYIRSLAMDVGHALGCGAHLSALRRVRIGPFSAADGVALAALESASEEGRDALLAPVDALVSHLARVDLDPERAGWLLQGRTLTLAGMAPGLFRVYAAERFLGLAEAGPDGKLSPKRLVATGDTARHP